MTDPTKYVGETWTLVREGQPGRRCEAIGATVCGKVLVQFPDGSAEQVNPQDLRNEQGQRVVYMESPPRSL